jgi:hypothetical protein
MEARRELHRGRAGGDGEECQTVSRTGAPRREGGNKGAAAGINGSVETLDKGALVSKDGREVSESSLPMRRFRAESRGGWRSGSHGEPWANTLVVRTRRFRGPTVAIDSIKPTEVEDRLTTIRPLQPLSKAARRRGSLKEAFSPKEPRTVT